MIHPEAALEYHIRKKMKDPLARTTPDDLRLSLPRVEETGRELGRGDDE